MLLPHYMAWLGSTGRFHCGWAERGLRNWAKVVANTSQKRFGGVFEGQCASRIREASMMRHAITQMDTQEDYLEEENDCPLEEATTGGSTFDVRIAPDVDRPRTKSVTCIRIDSNQKPHGLPMNLPSTLLSYFKRVGRMGDRFEVRTEAVMAGVRYRAHTNYRGQGPWYDFVKVKFDLMEDGLDTTIYPDDNLEYPAKLVCFFRLINADEVNDMDHTFSVLAHCAAWQMLSSTIYKRKTLLTRSWCFEVTPTLERKPKYAVVGTVEHPDIVGQIFAIEESPGFHESYPTEASRRFIVLSDMRKEWPRVFMTG
jgi:hypothetical protein